MKTPGKPPHSTHVAPTWCHVQPEPWYGYDGNVWCFPGQITGYICPGDALSTTRFLDPMPSSDPILRASELDYSPQFRETPKAWGAMCASSAGGYVITPFRPRCPDDGLYQRHDEVVRRSNYPSTLGLGLMER